jgi:hypothetical protein
VLIVASCATVVVAAGLASEVTRAAMRNPEDLLIVDCLLPGQVRKLGRQATFMSARRPLRTTQADCEIRGGEYVSYDRANYQTALQVWMGQAEQGDAEAQNYVGEIYAKGLGTPPDYAKAASWYEKAIAQGNKRAMINLGYLHEEGLGMPRDLARALNLYRQASGVTGDDLVFASTVTVSAEAQAEIASLKKTVEQQRAEAEQLRAQIDALRRQLDDRRRALSQSNRELEQARVELIERQTALSGPQDAAALQRLQAQLAAQESALKAEREQLEKDKGSWQAKVDADRARLAELRAQEQSLNAKLTAPAGGDAATVRKDLERVRAAATELALALDSAYTKVGELEARLGSNEQKLAAEQARFDEERGRMKAALAASQQDRELLLLLEQQLAEKQRMVSRQREQIVSLERQITSVAPGAASLAQLSASVAGPLVEIIEPALTVTRGRPAAMVRTAPSSSDVLGKVIARAGLSRLEVNGQPVTVDAGGLFKVRVPVAADGSNVQIAAIDRSGTRTALEFQLLPAPGGGAAASVTAPGKRTTSNVSLGRYHAVVIGNDSYGAYPKLASAANDARGMADVLSRKYGFKTRLVLNGTRFDILSALNEMRETLKPEDNLLVYFAGHGEIDAAEQGYWLPTDARADDPSTWISNRAISDILNTVASKHVLVIADSCYSGAMTRASVPAFVSAMGEEQWAKWVQTMAGSRSRTALTSGGLAPVPDSGSGGNSRFAKALLAALEDNNQLLEGQRLFREVTGTLALQATETVLLQIPEYAPIQFAGHEAGEFFFKPRS